MAAANEVQIVVQGQNKAKPAISDAKKDVKDLAKAVDAVPDKKVIDIKATDNATKTIQEVDAEKVADKNTKIKADDQATPVIDKISKTKPDEIKIPVRADKAETGNIGGELKDKFQGYGVQAGGVFGAGLVSGIVAGDFAGTLSGIFTDALQAAKDTRGVKIDLQNSMGLTDSMAKEYGQRVGKQYASGLGDSQDQIVQAYGSLSSAVKTWSSMSVSEQDKVTRSAVKIAQAFHIDVNEAIGAAGTMMDSGLVTSWNTAFDIITTGLQTLGPRGADFLETLTEYSGYFHQVGIDGQQALGLISQGLKNGARDTDYVADAWKELGIRIIDGSKDVQGALLDLGLATEKHVKEKVGKSMKDVVTIVSDIPGQIAAGGEGAQAALGKVIAKLQAIKDPVEQNRLGVALFGTQWEDTMRRMINATDLAGAKTTAFMGAADRLVTQSESQSEMFSRRWDRGLSRFGEGLATAANHVGDFIDSAAGLASGVFDGVIHGFDKAGDSAQGAGDKVNGFVDAMAKIADKVVAVRANTEDEKKIQSVAQQLKGLPPGTPVKVDAITSDAENRLRDLGYTVTHLPGGYVNVSANTNDAYKNVDDLVWWINRRQANIPVKISTSVTGPLKNIKGGMAANAAGGPVHGAASGGARTSLTRVNERGPELGRGQDGTIRDLETGSTVIPAGQSAAIMSGQSPIGMSSGGGPPVVVFDMAGLSGIERALAEWLRESVRTSGKNGSVQRWAT